MASLDDELAKVRRYSSGTPAQTRSASMLGAVEATLAEQSTAASPTALFATLSTTLDQLLQREAADERDELIAAALYVLAVVGPFVPASVLRAKADALIDSLGPLLVALVGDKAADAASLKSLLAIFQSVYVALSEKPKRYLVGSSARRETAALFEVFLPLLVDGRPKVRRKAHELVWAVVFAAPAASDEPESSKPKVHPYADRVGELVVEALEEAAKAARASVGNPKKSIMHDDAMSTLTSLGAFVKGASARWPAKSLPGLLALTLTLPRLQNAYLSRASYDMLELLLSPHSSSPADAATVATTLEALIALRPAAKETVVLPGWLGALETGFVALARVDPAACRAGIVGNFEGVLSLCASSVQAGEVRSRAEKTAVAFVRWCLGDAMTDERDLDDEASPIMRVVATVEEALGSLKWRGQGAPHLLAILTALFSRLRTRPGPSAASSSAGSDPRQPTAASRLLHPHLDTVGKMRAGKRFDYRDAADSTVGMAIEVCGPEWVLSVLPLNLLQADGSITTEGGRAWLLPILRERVTNDRLSHFATTLVPLSETLFNKKTAAGTESIEAKVFTALVDQIWATLPAYCDLPVDLATALTPTFATLLSNVLYSQTHLRPPILRALQLLVEKNVATANSSAPAEMLRASFAVDQARGRENVATLAKLAPDLLTVLFNVFGNAGREAHGAVLDCIATYLSILGPSDLAATYDKISGMLGTALTEATAAATGSATKTAQPTSHTMLDLLIAMAPHLAKSQLVALLALGRSEALLGCADGTVQKKAYRLLGKLCDVPLARGLVAVDVEALLTELVDGSIKCASAAKRYRTELLVKLIDVLPQDRLHIVPSVVPEAVLATKEHNTSARQAGYELILAMARKMQAGGTIQRKLIEDMDEDMAVDAPASLEEYVTMVSAGLVGASPHMISASLTALSRLLFEYHTQLPAETTSEIVQTVDVFLKSANREIVKSALGLVKVAVVALPVEGVRPHLPQLVPSLLVWSNDSKNHFKLKVRHVFERLVRKFGEDTIAKLVGDDDRKLLTSIRKSQQRQKRKKAASAASKSATQLDADAMLDSDGEFVDPKAKAKARGDDAYEDALYGSESDVASSGDEAAPARGRKGPAGRVQTAAPGRQRRAGKSAFVADGDEDDEPVDLLNTDRVTNTDPMAAARQRQRAQKALQGGARDRNTGKLLLGGAEEVAEPSATGGSTSAYMEAIKGADGHYRDARGKTRFNKRGRDAIDDDDDGADVTGKAAAPTTKRRKQDKVQLGAEFKAKRAGGDVRKPGAPQPFAYVPLAQATGKSVRGQPSVSFTGYGGKSKRGKSAGSRR